MEDNAPPTSSIDLPQVTILIENPSKTTNWGPLLRCCTAFGIPQIFAVGFDKCAVRGSHGASKHVEVVAFHDHASASKMLRDELGLTIVGLLQGAPGAYESRGYDVDTMFHRATGETLVQVKRAEITSADSGDSLSSFPKSFPLHRQPFARRTCLAIGKRPRGLSLTLSKLCDHFVHIPHEGISPESDALDDEMGEFSAVSTWISVEAGMSIVLHEFALWAGYGRAAKVSSGGNVVRYEGQKYHVKSKRKGQSTKEEQLQKQEERKARREQELPDETFLGTVFGSEADNADLRMGDESGDY